MGDSPIIVHKSNKYVNYIIQSILLCAGMSVSLWAVVKYCKKNSEYFTIKFDENRKKSLEKGRGQNKWINKLIKNLKNYKNNINKQWKQTKKNTKKKSKENIQNEWIKELNNK